LNIPGLKSARQVIRWFRSRVTAGGLVLGYHRVALDTDDPYRLCVRPRHFEEQMAVLHALTNPIHLSELLAAQKSGGVLRRAIVVTFDDGYLDNLENALPVLNAYSIPATFFIVTGNLGKPFWWDELAELVLNETRELRNIMIELAGDVLGWSPAQELNMFDLAWDNSHDRQRLLLELHRILLATGQKRRQHFISQLKFAARGNQVPSFSVARTMSTAELRQLAQNRLAGVGSHTQTHPVLPKISVEEQLNEVGRSKVFLERLLNAPVTSFSYPHSQGSKLTQHLVAQCGFSAACGGLNDVVRPNTDPLFLPRFWIPDWDGEKFARWLKLWNAD
jgi:peptidoglycan/xylan/chitin deacetylase (PgdA/CDA1 family)